MNAGTFIITYIIFAFSSVAVYFMLCGIDTYFNTSEGFGFWKAMGSNFIYAAVAAVAVSFVFSLKQELDRSIPESLLNKTLVNLASLSFGFVILYLVKSSLNEWFGAVYNYPLFIISVELFLSMVPVYVVLWSIRKFKSEEWS